MLPCAVCMCVLLLLLMYVVKWNVLSCCPPQKRLAGVHTCSMCSMSLMWFWFTTLSLSLCGRYTVVSLVLRSNAMEPPSNATPHHSITHNDALPQWYIVRRPLPHTATTITTHFSTMISFTVKRGAPKHSNHPLPMFRKWIFLWIYWRLVPFLK